MSTKIAVSSDTLNKLKSHLHEGDSMEDVIRKLLDLNDKYGESKPVEFELDLTGEIIKVIRVNDNMIEYFTPARKFSVTLSDWNLPDEFYDDWVGFISNPEFIPVLLDLGDNLFESGCFMI